MSFLDCSFPVACPPRAFGGRFPWSVERSEEKRDLSRPETTTAELFWRAVGTATPITAVILVIEILHLFGVSVPGPGIPLVAAVVFTGFSEGFQGGFYAALIGTMYEVIVYCYSSGLFRITPEGGVRIATFAASAALAAALVGILRKRAEDQTYALAKQRTAAALEEERKHLQNILQQLPLGVLVSDAESGEITFANDRALAILGVNLGRLHSIGHPTMFHVDSGRSYGPDEWPWRRCIQLRQAIDQNFLFAREDGELVAIGARACPVTAEDGKPIAAIMAFKRGMELANRSQG